MKNILFCGYGNLGKMCLERLKNEGYNVMYVLTHEGLEKDSVDTFCKNSNIEFSYQDSRKNEVEFKQMFSEMNLKYLVSVNYRYIIPSEIFNTADYAINIHGGLLPKYRGRTPHVWSIINGEEYSGITCHLIDKEVDKGNVIEQISVKIDNEDTGYTLLKKFENLYPDLLLKSLDKLERNYETIVQDENKASYFGKRTPDMGYIDFYKKANQIINFVRAQAYPYPGAYYYMNNGRKIIIDKIVNTDINYDAIDLIGVIKLIDNKYYVKCSDSILMIAEYRNL